MDDRTARFIANTATLEELKQFEANARARAALSDEVKTTISMRAGSLCRAEIAEKIGLDFSHLSPAEEKIVQAVSEYVALKKRKGRHAERTLGQLKRLGLIGAAEASVSKSKPTQGFSALVDADLEELSYEQIVVDHPEEFSARTLWYARRTLGRPNDSAKPPAKESDPTNSRTETDAASRRNPSWSREELIMALDLYLRFRHAPPAKTSAEVSELSAFLGKMSRAKHADEATYRNANGVYMKMMNFRRFDSEYTSEGKVGLNRGNKEEESVWAEFSSDTTRLAAAVAAIRSKADETTTESTGGKSFPAIPRTETPYWVFVCNPKKWAIDRFLDRRFEHDSWGIRPADRDRFAPGQLGIVRVGVDRRTVAERNGGSALEAGIYALCEVESAAFDGTGANDEFWAPGEAREPGWPTVKLRYLRTYLGAPLTIARLRAEAPDISPLLLNGLQAASFPIPADDFHAVVGLLGGEPNDPVSSTDCDVSVEQLGALEQKYLHACPEVKERLSKTIERGQIGALVKQLMGFKCQLCEALGQNPVGFLKRSGEPYIEAHHVMPVSTNEVGSLSASNVMTLCASHHRQMHYGGIDVTITATSFEFMIDGTPVTIPRLSIGPAMPEPLKRVMA